MVIETLVLRENTDEYMPRTKLSDRAAAKLQDALRGKGKVELVEDLSGDIQWHVRANGLAGIIALDDRLQVSILPKVSIASLLGLIEWTRELKLNPHSHPPAMVNPEEFMTRWLEIFEREVAVIIAGGLCKTYEPISRSAMPLRGRLNVARTMRRPGRVVPVCDYTVQTVDNIHNRILYAAVEVVRVIPNLQPTLVSSFEKQVTVLRHQVSLLPATKAEMLRPRYTPLTRHYATVHGMATLIFAGASPSLRAGSRAGPGLLLDTDRLFEEATYRYLDAALPPEYSASWAERHRFAGDAAVRPMEMDIVIRDQSTKKPLVVLDCKYKTGFEHKDCYQVVSYARFLDCDRAGLVFPTAVDPAPDGEFGREKPIALRHLVFDLSKPADRSGPLLVDRLLALLCS